VSEGRAIGRGHNQTEALQDPTAHAEILAIRQAAARQGYYRLLGATLYVTLEPCAMCAGALVLARVERVVFGATDPKAGACGSLRNVVQDVSLNHRCALEGGCLAEDCSRQLKAFFAALRAARS
jgi:tRNA(adenine34) deaminase